MTTLIKLPFLFSATSEHGQIHHRGLIAAIDAVAATDRLTERGWLVENIAVADPHPLAARISLARQARQLSQAQLAEQSGIPQPQISRLENAVIRDPSFTDIIKLAEVLNLSLNALADLDPALFIEELGPTAEHEQLPNNQARHAAQIEQAWLEMTSAEVRTELLDWIDRKANILIVGPPRTGKTTLLSALALRMHNPVSAFDRGGQLQSERPIHRLGPNEDLGQIIDQHAGRDRLFADRLNQADLAQWLALLPAHPGSLASLHRIPSWTAMNALDYEPGWRHVDLLITMASQRTSRPSSTLAIERISQVAVDCDHQLHFFHLYQRALNGQLQRRSAPLTLGSWRDSLNCA